MCEVMLLPMVNVVNVTLRVSFLVVNVADDSIINASVEGTI